jgi:ABC-type transporter Mla maintaining outer membrane lipid asymmetry ATPase subunit MlaF
MATLGYQFVSNCAGGGHTTIAVSFNGGASQNIVYSTENVRAPLSELTQEEREAAALVILKLHCAGMTRAQMKAALQAGVTVTL